MDATGDGFVCVCGARLTTPQAKAGVVPDAGPGWTAAKASRWAALRHREDLGLITETEKTELAELSAVLDEAIRNAAVID